MKNPFIYGHASNIDAQEFKDIFIDNDNSRILDSNNNIFINGNRGSGKSMLMRHHSFPIQENLRRIGIHIECRSPFFAKIDQYFNENSFQASIVSEHILVIDMALKLIQSIKNILFSQSDQQLLTYKLKFYFDGFLPQSENLCLDNFYDWLNKQIKELQTEFMQDNDKFVKVKTYNYLSLVEVIVDILKETAKLKDSHFMFLIDDAVLLNKNQKKTLNTWISYRNTTDVSFKVAITSTAEYGFLTNQSSAILENHDYITLDLEKNFFSEGDEFYKFAEKIIDKRLRMSGSELVAKDFFPVSESFNRELAEIKEGFIDGNYSEKRDKTSEYRKHHASKYTRAIYFRIRRGTSKANFPTLPYTGFKILTSISTGIVRNLLIPCNKMYEKESAKNTGDVVQISIDTQYQTLKEESEKAWSNITRLPTQIRDCTEEDAKQLENILSNFGKYLQNRLLKPDSSEKRILTFTIEDLDNHSDANKVAQIKKILNIGISGGLLYTRIGADHSGGKTIFYTPNRILWVSLGLDPIGQNGRHPIPVDNFDRMMRHPDLTYKNNTNQIELEL